MSHKLIWHLISNRWNSAITEYALSSAKALEKRGHRNIFSPIKNSPAERRSLQWGMETQSFEAYSLRYIKQIYSVFKKLKPDCIVLYGGKETFLAKCFDGAKILRFVGEDFEAHGFAKKILFSLSYSHVSKFIVPNQTLFKQMQAFKVSRPIHKIVLGLEKHKIKFENSSLKPHLLLLGRLDPVKGHERFLKIFALMKKKISSEPASPVLHILGMSANVSVEQLNSWIQSNGLSSDVIVTHERLENVHKVMSEAVCGVISSLGSEQICRVAEEFLLVGTPIFISGAGATEEVLFSGAGISYKGLSDEQAADRLSEFFKKSYLESSLERETRAKKAEEIFSLETMGKNLEEFIFS